MKPRGRLAFAILLLFGMATHCFAVAGDACPGVKTMTDDWSLPATALSSEALMCHAEKEGVEDQFAGSLNITFAL